MRDERDELIDKLEAALCECYDAALPQAQPFPGNQREKAQYVAKVLPQHLRGLNRLLDGKQADLVREQARFEYIIELYRDQEDAIEEGYFDKARAVIDAELKRLSGRKESEAVQ